MNRHQVNDQYFNWLSNIVCGRRLSNYISYNKLLMCLHETDFRYLIARDQNRGEAGISLRYRFAIHEGYEDSPEIITDYIDGPCSVLELMVAIAIYMEEHVMDNPDIGDRTGQWFWGMVVNLGLGAMNDDRFDRVLVEEVLQRFLERDYEPDGRGGLFRIRNCDQDLRRVAIFHQMCWYMNSIMDI